MLCVLTTKRPPKVRSFRIIKGRCASHTPPNQALLNVSIASTSRNGYDLYGSFYMASTGQNNFVLVLYKYKIYILYSLKHVFSRCYNAYIFSDSDCCNVRLVTMSSCHKKAQCSKYLPYTCNLF